MNIFASGRIGPSNVNFPKGFDKLSWNHVTTCGALEKVLLDNKVGSIVLDSFGFEDGSAYKASCMVVEITISKHVALPSILVIGPNVEQKKRIEGYLPTIKKWVDISRGK